MKQEFDEELDKMENRRNKKKDTNVLGLDIEMLLDADNLIHIAGVITISRCVCLKFSVPSKLYGYIGNRCKYVGLLSADITRNL